MKLLSKLLVAFVVLSGTAFAQSAKVDMGMGQLKAAETVSAALAAPSDGWTTVMSGKIRTSSQKDLTFGVSMVTSLFTDTTVASSRYTKSESQAEASVEVRVLIDDDPTTAADDDSRMAAPGVVTFDRRRQYLMAEFDGFACEILADGTIALDGCQYRDEILQLVLDTEAAHAFFFGKADVGVGDHVIQVQVRTVTSTSLGKANAQAVVGKGAFTVEEVRLVNGTNEDIIL